MKTQNISSINSTNFQGKVCLVNDLSAVPTRFVRKNAQILTDMFAEKNYNLYIKQNHSKNTVNFTVQKEKDYIKGNNRYITANFNQNVDYYQETAQKVIKDYEKFYEKPTLKETLKSFFKKLGDKLYDIITDEE